MASDREPDAHATALRGAIRTYGEEVKRAELERALNRLEARGARSAEREEIIRGMATTIVDRILGVPTTALENASAADRERLPDGGALFGLDRPGQADE